MLASRHTVRTALRVGSVRHVTNAVEMTAPPPAQGIMESFFSKSSMPAVPLDTPFPDLPPLSEATAQHQTEVTTLPSGLRVVSCDSNNPIASVAAFVDSGSRYETPENAGSAHFLEYFAFKSTKQRSDFKLVRDMLEIGANVLCATSREHTVYAADTLREHTPAVVNTLADVMQNLSFDYDELHEAIPAYKANVAEKMAGEPETQIMEAIHAAAYHNNTLGLPLYAPEDASFTKEALEAHMKTFYTADRMVVSGVGVHHDDLVKMVEMEFRGLNSGLAPPTEKANYTGGDIRLHNAEEHLTHVALAFETADWHSKDLVAMCMLQMMMGGGGSFSAGGPGKGMYSRLYQNLLNQHHWIESANSFNSIHSDSSIFGIYGTSAPDQAGNLVDMLSREFVKMTGEVDATELSRAKNQLKSSVNMQLEVRGLQLEDLGRQLMTYGLIHTPAELCAKIDAVQAADIQRVASDMLKTPVSVAVHGNTAHVPRYDVIARRFK